MLLQLLKDHVGQKAGFQFDTDDVIGKSLVDGGFAKQIPDDTLAPTIAKSLESSLKSITENIQTTIDNTLKAFANELTKSRKNSIPAIFGKGGNGDPKHTFGNFLLAVRHKNAKALEEMGSQYMEFDDVSQKASTLTTQTGETGGYMVPEQFHNEIMRLVSEMSVVRRKRPLIINQTGRVTQIPVLDQTSVPSAGESAFLGGMVMNWTEEATTISQTNPKIKQDNLYNYELAGYVSASNTLSHDAKGLESFLFRLFSDAISWYEDYAFLRGNGVGKPLGILTWAGVISVTRSAASAFALADYANMLSRWLPNFNAATSGWTCHPTVLAKLFTMADAEGSVLFIDNAQEKPRMMLGGLPLEVTEKVPALNTAGDIFLNDFSKYVIGDPQQLAIAFSEHVNFLSNQGCWRAVSRVGGMPWLKDKITLADGTSTLSPTVTLAAG